MDLVCFTLIIDDIVLPDGTTCMAQLGGGGSQSLFGFQLVSKCLQRPTTVGLTAGVGCDLPEQCKVAEHPGSPQMTVAAVAAAAQFSICSAYTSQTPPHSDILSQPPRTMDLTTDMK